MSLSNIGAPITNGACADHDMTSVDVQYSVQCSSALSPLHYVIRACSQKANRHFLNHRKTVWA